MQIVEIIHAFGHENVQATHRSTLEITKEKHLTKEGDCIVAVAADKGLIDFDERFRKHLLMENAKVAILIEAGGVSDTVTARGGPKLVLTHPTDIVVRESSHICSRTLAIGANKAACDLSRTLAAKLKNPNQEVTIELIVKT